VAREKKEASSRPRWTMSREKEVRKKVPWSSAFLRPSND